MRNNLIIDVSKYVSYLLRHNPDDLRIDDQGFVELDKLLSKIRRRFPEVDRDSLIEIVSKSERKRFEMVGNRIRALYGHTIDVHISFQEDQRIGLLYHGTTSEAAREILKKGLQSMRRKWVHLSPTVEIAREIGQRKTINPVILLIDAAEARTQGVKFYRATDKVYVCKQVPAGFIKMRS